MTREKQIEEMAVILTDGGCTKCNCDENGKFNCLPMHSAVLLYNSGYRKQSEGEWKLAYNSYPHYVCSHCNHLYNNKSFKYCPYCGARMSGGKK